MYAECENYLGCAKYHWQGRCTGKNKQSNFHPQKNFKQLTPNTLPSTASLLHRSTVNMAKWSRENRIFSPVIRMDDWEWKGGLGSHGLRNSIRSSIPVPLSEFGSFKSQSSAWKCMGVSELDHYSKVSTSRFSGQYEEKKNDSLGMRRWQSSPRLAPEDVSQSHWSQGVEMHVALEENSMRKAKLIQKLREAHGCLDSQTGLLKAKELQLSQTAAQLLELKHTVTVGKAASQLAKALSALEQEEEPSHFQESHQQAESHDKVLDLQMDMKMESNLENRSTARISNKPTVQKTNPQLNRTMPVTKDAFFREGQKKALSQGEKLQPGFHPCVRAQSELQNLQLQPTKPAGTGERLAHVYTELGCSTHLTFSACQNLLTGKRASVCPSRTT
ncbi:uncharacterized protein LOC143515230 [Brachyhypopomus gauderio]|uniref:uncharacterized protein LOC143515230 n=1 Tax=Brachyhypopomus gauderio TaxID=698409 RepID=UPI00404388D5